MPPRWNEYRKVIGRNGFKLVRSKKHETWVKHDAEGRVIGHTSVSHGNAQIRDKTLFKELLQQSKKTEKHFYDVLKGTTE
jgi:predicted RNA binding protein YcfA (HicA-like mRNA interferase family)